MEKSYNNVPIVLHTFSFRRNECYCYVMKVRTDACLTIEGVKHKKLHYKTDKNHESGNTETLPKLLLPELNNYSRFAAADEWSILSSSVMPTCIPGLKMALIIINTGTVGNDFIARRQHHDQKLFSKKFSKREIFYAALMTRKKTNPLVVSKIKKIRLTFSAE